MRAGELVAFPTETVYGLGANACDGRAVAAIFAAKRRPAHNPLIVHVPAIEHVDAYGVMTRDAQKLARAFWPGGLTLIVEKAPFAMRTGDALADPVSAGLDTVAVRVPENAIARALLRRAGVPVAAPSANRSGRLSPTCAADVVQEMGGRVALVLDDGPCRAGVESTIVSCVSARPVLLRPGAVVRDDIECVLGAPLADFSGAPDRPVAPGMLRSHYAPRAGLRLNATSPEEGEAFLDFAESAISGVEEALAYRDLSVRGDLVEAAANLFAMLRVLDCSGARTIAVAPVPMRGLGEAINDRLARAAAPRGPDGTSAQRRSHGEIPQ